MHRSIIQIILNFVGCLKAPFSGLDENYNFCSVFFFCCYMKAKRGYRNLTGIDYSAASVELARNVLQAADLTDVTVKVSLVIFVFML